MTAIASQHGIGCACSRCVGFEPGHALSTRHGAYSSVRLAPRAVELEADLVRLVPTYTDSDGPAVALLATTLARVERAAQAVDDAADDPDGPKRLEQDLRGWVNTAARLLDALGMTPTSRARLGLDLARVEDTLAQLAADGRATRESSLQEVSE